MVTMQSRIPLSRASPTTTKRLFYQTIELQPSLLGLHNTVLKVIKKHGVTGARLPLKIIIKTGF